MNTASTNLLHDSALFINMLIPLDGHLQIYIQDSFDQASGDKIDFISIISDQFTSEILINMYNIRASFIVELKILHVIHSLHTLDLITSSRVLNGRSVVYWISDFRMEIGSALCLAWSWTLIPSSGRIACWHG